MSIKKKFEPPLQIAPEQVNERAPTREIPHTMKETTGEHTGDTPQEITRTTVCKLEVAQLSSPTFVDEDDCGDDDDGDGHDDDDGGGN